VLLCKPSTISDKAIALSPSFFKPLPGRVLLDKLQSVRKQLGTRRAIMMVLFHLGMWPGALLGHVDMLFGGIVFPAAFTALERMLSDDRVPNFDSPQLPSVLHVNHMGGAQIGTSATANASPADGHHQHATAVPLHAQGLTPDNLFADTHTQPAPDAAIRCRRQGNRFSFRQIVKSMRLGGHLNQALKGLESSLLNRFALRMDTHPLFDFQDTAEQDQASATHILNLHCAQFAASRRFEGGMITERRNVDTVFSGHVQDRETVVDVQMDSVNLNID
jgi:hypothetical protein